MNTTAIENLKEDLAKSRKEIQAYKSRLRSISQILHASELTADRRNAIIAICEHYSKEE